MKQFLAWSTIALPPTFLILLSIKPLEIISLRLLGCLAVLFLAIIIAILIVRPTLRSQKHFRRKAIASLMVVISIVLFNWPLKIAYAFSRPAFNQVAEQVMVGEIPTTPRRIGWFRIEGVEAPSFAANGIDRQGLRLWTGLHTNGNTGFVQASPGNLKFNLWSHFKLDDTWQFIAED